MQGREILIGVTGGIAAFKTAALVSQLVQAGAGVSVVMTRSALRLIGARTFEALSGRPVRTAVFGRGAAHPHIELAARAEVFCVAPATANILAKAAWGLADDLLSTVLLAFDGPVIMAPAMNNRMWEKPAVQRNVAQLRADGVLLVDPEEGYLSCGSIGAGRMASPERLLQVIAETLAATQPRTGRDSKAQGAALGSEGPPFPARPNGP
ncbi:MAG: flavoprotein [Thermoguttaceae bacterium]|jgi:phosphopantothenoylcysteine decarboxylase/phosphopantothenate--cysteine ligase